MTIHYSPSGNRYCQIATGYSASAPNAAVRDALARWIKACIAAGLTNGLLYAVPDMSTYTVNIVLIEAKP